MMAALEDEIAAALKQVGAAGAAGANVPALLETIMGAMAAGQQAGTRDGGKTGPWTISVVEGDCSYG